jgi:serine/threonine protein kinase
MPATLGRYEVRAKIGEGGMAAVYVGRQRDGAGPDRLVALKVIKDEFAINQDFVHMFIDEARIVARLWHPNIVKVYELGKEKGRLFISMELLRGQSLLELWEASRAHGQRLPFHLLAWVGARICEGLHHAHETRDGLGNPQQIIHRDVNPSNVFISYVGEVKIIDFGLAKAINRMSKTAAGVVKGKLGYLSPEQARGFEVDRRADIFALGTTLWELMADQRLFRQADDIETLKRIHAAVVPDLMTLVPDFPPALWAIIKKSLAKDRDARHATAEAMAHDLDAFARSSPRPINAETLTRLMQELFDSERKRQDAWIHDASGPTPAPLVTLKPPSHADALPVVVVPAPPRLPQAAPMMPPPSVDAKVAGSRARGIVVALIVAAVVMALGIGYVLLGR